MIYKCKLELGEIIIQIKNYGIFQNEQVHPLPQNTIIWSEMFWIPVLASAYISCKHLSNYLTCLNLNFTICKMGLKFLPD